MLENFFGTKLKKNVWFIIMLSIGLALVIFNIVYGIIFSVAVYNMTVGDSIFASELHLNLLITAIVLNAVYLLTLGIMLLVRRLKDKK